MYFLLVFVLLPYLFRLSFLYAKLCKLKLRTTEKYFYDFCTFIVSLLSISSSDKEANHQEATFSSPLSSLLYNLKKAGGSKKFAKRFPWLYEKPTDDKTPKSVGTPTTVLKMGTFSEKTHSTKVKNLGRGDNST
uniref:Uncharacterized protein n=1 Tax=Romanomermis culicivorax TaxID=13658 RepID=A0A915JX94_ROMCU